MRFNFSYLSHLLIEDFLPKNKGAGERFCDIAKLIDPDNPSFDWEANPSGYTDIYNKGRDFSSAAKKEYQSLPFEERRKQIDETFFSEIPEKERYLLKTCLTQWIEEDGTIPSDTIVFTQCGYKKRRLSEPNSLDPLDFLTESFAFALNCAPGKKFPKEEVAEKIASLRNKKGITDSVLNPELKTVNEITIPFESVFKEMKLPSLEGIHEPNEFRAYHLAIQDHAFVMERLKALLKKNIGNYVFTRMMIDRYVMSQDEASINLEAMDAIRKHKNLSKEDIADILLYLFLEHVLNAPKIMSGYELLDSNQFDFTGIHLLGRKDLEGKDFYQLVLGTSCLSGGLEEAIRESIDRLGRINRNRPSSLQLFDKIDLKQRFNSSQVDFLKKVLVPEGPSDPLPETGFGLFVGYRSDIEIPDSLTNEKIVSIEKSMKDELSASVPTIKESLKQNGLMDYSVYLYLVPFNDPRKDVGSILDDFMGRTAE